MNSLQISGTWIKLILLQIVSGDCSQLEVIDFIANSKWDMDQIRDCSQLEVIGFIADKWDMDQIRDCSQLEVIDFIANKWDMDQIVSGTWIKLEIVCNLKKNNKCQ